MRRIGALFLVLGLMGLPLSAGAGTVPGLGWVVDHLATRVVESGSASLAVNLGSEVYRPGERIDVDPQVIGESIIPELSVYSEDGEYPRNLPPLDPLNPLAGETNLIDVSALGSGLDATPLDALGEVGGMPTLMGPAIAFFAIEIDGELCEDPEAPTFGFAFKGLFDEPWEAEDLPPEYAPLEGFGRMITIDCLTDGPPVVTGLRNSEFGAFRQFDTDALGWMSPGFGVIGLSYEVLRGPSGAVFGGRGAGQPVEVVPAFDADTPLPTAAPDVFEYLGADPDDPLDALLIEWIFGPSGDEEEVCMPPAFGRRLLFNIMPEYGRAFDAWTSLPMEVDDDSSRGIRIHGVGPDYELDVDLKLDGSVALTKTSSDGTECTQEGSAAGVDSILPELTSTFGGDEPSSPVPPSDDGGGFPWPAAIVVGTILTFLAWYWSNRPKSKPQFAIKVDGGDDFIEYPDDDTDSNGD